MLFIHLEEIKVQSDISTLISLRNTDIDSLV